VTRADANQALQKRLSRKNLAMTVVATASQLRPELAALKGLDDLKVVPFNRV
jgi:hypothetical protein